MARKLSRRAIATYVGDQLLADASSSVVVEQLAAYLIDTRRTKELHLVVRDIQTYLASKGYIVGTVTTAFDLSAATQKAIEAYAKKASKASEVTLDPITDPSVLGGVKISLPGYELDATVARQLTTLKTRFKKA